MLYACGVWETKLCEMHKAEGRKLATEKFNCSLYTLSEKSREEKRREEVLQKPKDASFNQIKMF